MVLQTKVIFKKMQTMLTVVSNTTPILSLLKISQLDIFKELYKEIYIPQAVYQEIEAGREMKFYQNLANYNWIQIKTINDLSAVEDFLDLDAGEAETIILVKEQKADLVIIDEKLGRWHA